MLRYISSFLLVWLSTFAIFAQTTYSISGMITDDKAIGIDLALVTLMTEKDSILKVTYTDQDGSFLFSSVIQGNYNIKTSILGYETLQKTIEVKGLNNQIKLGSWILTTNAQLLDAVTITAKTPFIERKIDRTVVNVDALIANAGSNALEALERAPGISLDQDGAIKLKGRSGVTVFIDDKPTYLSGTELENYLKSLPASSIKQIEIMPNPPAKYEAAGNSGVINIITKRTKTYGFHGNTVLSVQQGRYTRSNNSVNLNFNKNKVSLYANLNGGFRNSFQDLNINRYYKNDQNIRTSSFSQNSFIVKDGQSGNVKLGLDYYVSDHTTLGFSAKGLLSNAGDQTDNTAFVRDAENKTLNRVLADNNTKNTFNNGTFNVYLKHLLDTIGSMIIIDADYVKYKSGSDQLFNNFIYDNANVLTYDDIINGEIPSEISIYAAKIDFTKPLNATSKFEAGLKSAFTQTDNEAIYTNTIDGVTLPDFGLSNKFLYDEWIHAAYINYNRKLGKLDLQLGLRAETTNLKGKQLGNEVQPDTNFTRTYTNVFPTFYASYQADSLGNHIMVFSFGRRIDRPFFQDLNPFISPLDKFTFYGGNPGLLPTYSNNFSLTHTYKNSINTSLSYGLTTDGINETLEIREGIYYSRPGNISTNHTLSLSVDASTNITKWYRLNTYIELGHQIFESKLYTEQLDTSGTYFAANVTNSFQLGKGWNADVRGDYQSNIVYAQLLIKSFGTLNLGIQKKILNDKGSIKLSLSDILYTRRADGIINNLKDTDADWNSRLDTRSATIAFSYRFGKSTSNKPKYTGSGSDSEQRRVKG
ncbi:MAG TPA: outer membrane beta-barrel protein [Saprospiraceae bacterium]|nr:outer membrane beta-barrel protein [Saprospiraceae bacterium]